MQEYFLKLFRFNQWANELIGTFLDDNDLHDPKTIRIMSHLVHAQENWYKRTVGQQQDAPVWDLLAPTEITGRLSANDRVWIEFIEQTNQADFQAILPYNNLQGEGNLSSMEDILAHVVNHASYHRGQVIYLIRELDITPPSTDFIKFTRM